MEVNDQHHVRLLNPKKDHQNLLDGRLSDPATLRAGLRYLGSSGTELA
jgi:hypothetical protein